MENVVLDKSFDFSVRVIKLCRYLRDDKHEFDLSRQLLRSGTSIGANVREAVHAQSRKDFISKMNIEANESLYWIELFASSDILDAKQKDSIWKDCNELVSLLVSIVKTSKESESGHG